MNITHGVECISMNKHHGKTTFVTVYYSDKICENKGLNLSSGLDKVMVVTDDTHTNAHTERDSAVSD